MAKGLAVAAVLAFAAGGAAALPADEASLLIGTPVYFDGMRYGVIERVMTTPEEGVHTLFVRPDAPASEVYALDWRQVRVEARSGAIVLPGQAAQLATLPED